MATWSPPEFTYHRYPDGTLVAIGSDGEPLACQPTLVTKTVDIVDPSSGEGAPARTATVVFDQWGNRVDQYEIRPYTVQICTRFDEHGATENIAVAMDADGQPVTLVPNMEVIRRSGNDIDVTMPDGSTATFDAYDGPQDIFIHYAKSHSHEEGGTPTIETIVVDADGVPFPVQPFINHWDLTGNKPTGEVWWSGGSTLKPPVYEFPEFSVHLEYPSAALEGHSSASPMPIAVGADGKPLAIQPEWQVDPSDPSNVQAVMPNGQLRDAKPYEFPDYRVQLQYSPASYHGATAAVPHAVAVDEAGVPLPIQPTLSVDPPDPSDPTAPVTVTATYGDHTTEPVEVQRPPKDFFVHVESSGPGGAHGAVSYAATAVDGDGQPLPIQPHLVVDTDDPTRVTAHFPDGTTSMPTPLYPPPGEPPDTWPPAEWPPKSDTDETDETDELDETVELDRTATAPDDVTEAQSDSVTAEGLDDAAAQDTTAAARDDVEATSPETEQASAPLGETLDSGDRYSGVEMAEGEIAIDDDLNEPNAIDDLVTAGLDEPMTTGSLIAEQTLGEVADDTATPAEVSETDGLVTAGLEPEIKVEEAELKVEEGELKVEEPGPELRQDEPVEQISDDYVPLPPQEPVAEQPSEIAEVLDIDQTIIEAPEPIENPSLAAPVEAAPIEPIEILVEPLGTPVVREVSPIGESDGSDRLASLEPDADDEEEPQP